MHLQSLISSFAIPGQLTFSENDCGLIRASITTAACSAELYLQGAHLTAWQPADQKPVLFLSGRSSFISGKAIRGGIPIVFPWFGSRTATPTNIRIDGPSHGFARISDWDLIFAGIVGEDLVLTLTLGPSVMSRDLGFDKFQLVYQITLGRELRLKLTVANSDVTPLHFEEAFHSYFAVGDTQQVSLIGLSDTDYIDKADNFKRKRQTVSPLTLTGKTDRPYLDTLTPVNIVDPVLHRRITVDKSNSMTTVVWNPWSNLSNDLPDMDSADWREMICVETANVADNAITLPFEQSHSMQAHIIVEVLPSS